MRSRLCVLAAAAAACSSAGVPAGSLAPAPDAPTATDGAPSWPVHATDETEAEEATVVVHAGGDTIAVERFSRIGRTLTGHLTRPDHVMEYTLVLRRDGRMERMEVRITPLGDTTPAQRFWATFEGDSVQSRTLAGDAMLRGGGVVPPGTLPMVDASPALLELVLRQARRSGAADVRVPVLVLGNPSVVLAGRVRFSGRDSARVTLGEATTLLRVDALGRILDGLAPSVNARFERTSGVGATRRTAAARPGAH